MFTNIAITPLFVSDQDAALRFYTEVLGFEVHTDADLGVMRWLTISLPGHPEREIILQRPGAPSLDPATAEQVVELTARGATTWVVLQTDDVHAAYATLTERGAEITQEPMEREYGTDMALRDPFGNQIRITQPPRG
ncbi:VOC family protein [Mariniluteicoccus endophyticus]